MKIFYDIIINNYQFYMLISSIILFFIFITGCLIYDYYQLKYFRQHLTKGQIVWIPYLNDNYYTGFVIKIKKENITIKGQYETFIRNRKYLYPYKHKYFLQKNQI
jgi:cytochrome b subunit of formate dehydrogenase